MEKKERLRERERERERETERQRDRETKRQRDRERQTANQQARPLKSDVGACREATCKAQSQADTPTGQQVTLAESRQPPPIS